MMSLFEYLFLRVDFYSDIYKFFRPDNIMYKNQRFRKFYLRLVIGNPLFCNYTWKEIPSHSIWTSLWVNSWKITQILSYIKRGNKPLVCISDDNDVVMQQEA